MPISHDDIVRVLMRDRPKLLAYVWAIVRDHHAAEDLLQEVSVLAVHKRAEIEGEEHFGRWLRQSLRYKAMNLVNKAERRTLTLDAGVLDQLDRRWDEQPAADTADLAAALRRCMSELPPHARELVDLRYSRGLSGQRLASAVGKQLNTVYVSLSRVHRTLERCVRERLEREEATDA
jgi:RNA polymerase sigma-70 factor (ECF subfamily)